MIKPEDVEREELLIRRLKVLFKRSLLLLGVHEDVGLIPVAIFIGIITSLAAVAFHESIEFLKQRFYEDRGGDWLYGSGIWLIVLIPAIGGLIVGLIGRYLIRAGSSHGVADVIESVIRTRGFVRPIVAIEKIFTAAITIGTGGSAGAEGPIVQIGAAISSGVGKLFAISPQQMPLLVGCGTAAGISSIFHSPIGGVIFTMEVIVRDFSPRVLVPIIVASVIANVATEGAYAFIEPDGYRAIFETPQAILGHHLVVTWGMIGQFILLGIFCGIVGVCFTRTLLIGEHFFYRLRKLGVFRPLIGGLMLGLSGLGYVLLFGWLLNTDKPIPFEQYPMPAFFGDGYGVVKSMLAEHFAGDASLGVLLALLITLLLMKIIGTTLTLGSGGSGGIIAPSLFMGATTGTILGVSLRSLGIANSSPAMLAFLGMGAALAAIVHAPLASILIVFELTQNPAIMVPAMVATITAYTVAKTVLPDSIYTLELRDRGLSPEATMHTTVLRKFSVDHLSLDAITSISIEDSITDLIDLASRSGESNFVVTTADGNYCGIITQKVLQTLLIQFDAIPLLTIGEILRKDITPIRHSENLAVLFEAFVQFDTDAIPVGLDHDQNQIIGIVTRDNLMQFYHAQLQ